MMIPLTVRRAMRGSVLAALLPFVAHAQHGDSLLKAQLQNGMFPPAEARPILQVVAAAEAAHLPTDFLEREIRDGAATNASGAQVLRTVRADLAALNDAQRAVGPLAPETTIEMAGRLLLIGMPIATLREFHIARPSQNVGYPVAVAERLIRRGVPVDAVSTDLATLVRAGASDTVLMRIELAVERAWYDGAPVLDAYRAQAAVR